jgi:hypothetical protein
LGSTSLKSTNRAQMNIANHWAFEPTRGWKQLWRYSGDGDPKVTRQKPWLSWVVHCELQSLLVAHRHVNFPSKPLLIHWLPIFWHSSLPIKTYQHISTSHSWATSPIFGEDTKTQSGPSHDRVLNHVSLPMGQRNLSSKNCWVPHDNLHYGKWNNVTKKGHILMVPSFNPIQKNGKFKGMVDPFLLYSPLKKTMDLIINSKTIELYQKFPRCRWFSH